jgi:hypothetical protein
MILEDPTVVAMTLGAPTPHPALSVVTEDTPMLLHSINPALNKPRSAGETYLTSIIYIYLFPDRQLYITQHDTYAFTKMH